jgi:acetyltransferase-like isoleucine patch superfamily enzyme
MFYKFFWFIRGLVYSPFFGKFGFPSYLGKPISVYGINKIIIGKRVRIQPHVRMEVHGKKSRLIIEDNVSIGQNVHLTTGSRLVIQKSCTILANTFITDIDHNYQEIGVHIMAQKMDIKNTEIGQNCFIGIGVAIQAGTILGKQCIVGANSVVRGIFPDYCVIAGNPAKIIKKYNFNSQEWERI